MAYILTQNSYETGDAVYIIDVDEIGIVDEVFNIGDNTTFIAVETQDTFLIVNSTDPFIIKL